MGLNLTRQSVTAVKYVYIHIIYIYIYRPTVGTGVKTPEFPGPQPDGNIGEAVDRDQELTQQNDGAAERRRIY